MLFTATQTIELFIFPRTEKRIVVPHFQVKAYLACIYKRIRTRERISLKRSSSSTDRVNYLKESMQEATYGTCPIDFAV